jgi:hypothetical protein
MRIVPILKDGQAPGKRAAAASRTNNSFGVGDSGNASGFAVK